ncbi:MAG: two-component sensor histidine kinase [Frankiales bacterium]|nr:two-component sensor histidine kinase [Frankiales bacterium]
MTTTAAILVVLAFVLGAAVSALIVRALLRRERSIPASDEPQAGRESGSGALAPRVLGAIDVGVVVVDRDEIAVLANQRAREMRVVHQDRLTLPVLRSLVREVADSGSAASATIDLAPAVGGPEILTFRVSAVPLDQVGRVTTVLLQFSDITETLRLERVRRDFVANVSHELKTPVGALTLLAEAVQDAADDPEAVQRFSHRMQREGARLGRLVQELIELSRLQGAEPLPGPQLVDVEHILSEAVDRSRLAAESSGITVVDRTEAGLQVRGNETQLANAVANLVDNAIAYSSEHTKVGVAARSVREATGEWVEIAVTDQGIGIAEGDLDRVFERFYRVDQARSRATGGTGLGLAIVKHIASNHGGGVSVWSVAGSGSTFTIRLPLAGRGAEATPESAADQAADPPTRAETAAELGPRAEEPINMFEHHAASERNSP